MIRKHIPNAITCLNLASGCIAVAFAFQEAYFTAALFVALAAVFDFLDGFAARLLKAYSPMGKELDSLADLVSFGVVPGAMVYNYTAASLDTFMMPSWPALTALLIPVFSALRLAKFNLDERQTESFLGLPTPANALFWAFGAGSMFDRFAPGGMHPYILIAAVLFFSLLLVSEIPMFSMKFRNLSWKNNSVRFVFLACSLLLLLFFQLDGLPFCILLYIFTSLTGWVFVKKQRE